MVAEAGDDPATLAYETNVIPFHYSDITQVVYHTWACLSIHAALATEE